MLLFELREIGAITSGALEGTIAKTRGVAGTTVAITLRRGDQTLQLLVQRQDPRIASVPRTPAGG